jgi:hypothetical protein
VEAAIPELAALARCFLYTHLHKTPATLRYDGYPEEAGAYAVYKDCAELLEAGFPEQLEPSA